MRNIKRVLIGALLSLFVLTPVLGMVPEFVGTAHAATYPQNTGTKDLMGIVAYMTGNGSSPSNYTVTATRRTPISGGQYKNTITFTYMASGLQGIDSHPLFFADLGHPIVEITGCNGNDSTVIGQNTFDISVTKGGKSVFSGESVNMCTTNPVGALYQAGTLTVQDSQTGTASVSGTFQYNDPTTGQTLPFDGTKTTATLTEQFGNKSVIHLSVDKNGNFAKSGLTPGDYTIDANQASTVTGGISPTYGPRTITLKAGKNNLGILNSSTEPPGGGGTADPNTPTCESTVPGLGWAICQLIDGLQAAIGGIYDNVIEPLLITKPLVASTSDPIYKAWSNFRIYGDVFLVIAILVIVFGESLGGGLIDAYTAKKVLPKLLVAAILINLSYYIVAVLVDITNIVGNGLMTLITAPFGLTGDFSLDIGATGATTLSALLLAAVVWAKVSLAGQWVAWLWFVVLLPMFLVFMAILVVVLLRRALIVLLVIISPVAFALYCLPNTEKYFRKWWEILSQTLLVYPIIAVMFAMGKVGAYLINHSGGGNFALNGIAQIMSIVTLVIPLLLIPFSFRVAGGILGRLHDAIDGARLRAHKATEGTRARIHGQSARNRVQSRQKAYQNIQGGINRANKTKLGRYTIGKGLSGLNAVVGGYNIEAASSAARAETSKVLNDQIATGADSEIRGLTVNKRTSRKRQASDGTWEYETLGGAWVSEADVDKGHARWGHDTFAQQTALAYEMRKAQDEGQLQNLGKNFASVAQGPGGWGMNDQQAGGAWIGAAFEHQNQHLEYKSTDWKTGQLKADSNGMAGAGLVDEIYEKRGSYNVAQMGSNTVEQLKNAHTSAQAVYNDAGSSPEARLAAQDQMDKIKAISETFMHEYGSMGGDPSEVHDTTTPSGRRQASTPGAAHIAERVRELATMTGGASDPNTGLGGSAPSGEYGGGHLPGTPTPTSSGTPTRNRREQS